MTEKEIEKLAELITDKLMAKQKKYDEEFKADIQSMVDENTNIEFGTITQDELIIEEIDGLQETLDRLETEENYEAARIVANKIKHLKNKYKL